MATYYGIFYVGAPYGENETGELVSKHKTEVKAKEQRAKLQDQARYYGSNTIIRECNAKGERIA